MNFKINKNIISIEEFKNVAVFGITAEYEDEIIIINDISCNRLFVEQIAEKLKINEVSKYHIYDVIEDEIS